MIQVNSISKKFGKDVVFKKISFQINDNEKLNKELNEMKINYRKSTKLLIDICDILVNNSVINNLVSITNNMIQIKVFTKENE